MTVRVSSPLLLAMSKRGPDGSSSKPRKRRWKGISTTVSILDFADTPSSEAQVMHVWHTRVEDPSTSRKSLVTILQEPQTEEADAGVHGEDLEDIAPASTVVSVGPKRRRGNDSVSYPSQAICKFPVILRLLSLDRQRWRHGYYLGRLY